MSFYEIWLSTNKLNFDLCKVNLIHVWETHNKQSYISDVGKLLRLTMQ